MGHRFGLCVVVAFLSVVAVAKDAPGVFDNGMCWNVPRIPLSFDADLAPELENPTKAVPPVPSAGDARTRKMAFDAAVDAWNRALVLVGSTKRIVAAPRPPRPWPAEQSRWVCVDRAARQLVYEATYLRTSPDGHNAAATAWASRSQKPGWVVGMGQPETYAVCGRLAETKLVPPPSDNNGRFIAEADVLYFTHLREGNDGCAAIPWDYRSAPVPAGAYYDFYSVMLHEIGHALGLDHQECAEEAPGVGTIPNVMAARLRTGVRAEILACERAALERLYGVRGRCRDAP